MNFPSSFGMLSLAIGFIVWGLSMMIGFGLPGLVVGLWLLITGILLLVGR